MKTPVHHLVTLLVAICLLSTLGHAAVLIPVDAAAWNGGEPGAGDPSNAGGLFQTTTGELFLNKLDPNNPATWTSNTNWNGDFQGRRVNEMVAAGTNPWIVYDLGSSQTALDSMFIITNTEGNRGFKDIQVFYSDNLGSNTVSTWAGQGGSVANSTYVTYDFSAGGWTQFGGTHTITRSGNPLTVGLTLDISAISSARYIGIRALSSYADDGGSNPFGTATGNDANNRAGINQIAFTTIPEPGTAILVALGFLLLLRRRR